VTNPISYWHDSLEPGDALVPRPALPGDRSADVAIIGAGFAGLWTGYYLLLQNPKWNVAIVEAETAGFGASGRNGGWCIPEAGTHLDILDQEGGPGTGARMMREVFRTVGEIGSVAQRESIDCGFAKGGALWFATDGAQFSRMNQRFALLARHGLDDVYQLLDARRTIERVNATSVFGSIFLPEAAAVHPARLARGIARAFEGLGGTIYEKTPATRIDGRRVVTPHGVLGADIVVRTTEAYSNTIAGYERNIVPIASFVIATAPIADELWAEIGLRDRELFEDTPERLAYGPPTSRFCSRPRAWCRAACRPRRIATPTCRASSSRPPVPRPGPRDAGEACGLPPAAS
jgi:glycine/D-amino acid oxidase-like deaminating enzyme